MPSAALLRSPLPKPVEPSMRIPDAWNALNAMAAVVFSLSAPAAVASDTWRIEVHPITTLDVATAPLLRGDPVTGAPVRTIAGELRLPYSTQRKVPAVVMLQGDAGAVGNQPPWIDELNAIGIAVFTLDSFSGRGAVSTSPQIGPFDGPLPGALPRVIDAYRALDLLAHHPRIDPLRVVLMGFSSGGRTTLLAAMKRFSAPLAPTDAAFAAYVALYPPCNARLVDDERLGAGPVRIFSGGADVVTRAEPCRLYVERLRCAGVDAAFTAYPGAFHGFDNPRGPVNANAALPGSGACRFDERDHVLVNVDTGRPLAEGDACVQPGFTAGRDAAADTAVRAAVRDLLLDVLKPER